MTVFTETVRMAKSRPSKNQLERSDLLQDYLPYNKAEDWPVFGCLYESR